ncbi:ABC transporter permease subunit [Desulforhopalus singaporensis]|uniref:Glycine betaine/proline transport system permease protein n=1 Tax=Desulforhopalus singaporensis TaxID=91360 RepID=A0A1H0UQX1_9BACT|nr:ABC transporter permease subunit [Desulforhopalus singaporensis]SDP68500.1 glycine betaine/proline transport system permease protein [Desulforhopalus singaporensis]
MVELNVSIWHNILNPLELIHLPLDIWVDELLNWLVGNYRWFFQLIRAPIDFALVTIEHLLQNTPEVILLILGWFVSWQFADRKTTVFVLISMVTVGLVGAWSQAMTTLALVITSVVFCIIIGLPMGILLSRSSKMEAAVRPVLDAMQTTPAFVYLIPVVMLFGVGNVPGIIVTIVFALPPLVRLTILGIHQVPSDVIEAAYAFGASERQVMVKIKIPLALRTIMTGINQTLMLSLSMVVVASMIAVGGLGQMVLRGIGRLDIGQAAIGGLGIVLMAIALDRVTQGMGLSPRMRGTRFWYQKGPVHLLIKLRDKVKDATTNDIH